MSSEYFQLLERFLLIRAQLREDYRLLAFILNYDKVAFLSSDYHDVGIHNRRTRNFTLTEMPRGTYKTTTFTIVETIQDILIDRNIRILICHFAGANARDMLSEISTHFITSDILRFLFPDICPENTKRPETENWTNASITVKRSKEKLHLKEGTIEALGSEQSMASKHFDKIKFDDLVTEQSTTTVDQIKKSVQFLLRSYSLLNNHDPARSLSITGTEWVPDDAMVQLKEGKILAPDGKPFSLFRIPAEITDKETNSRRSLFPDILPLEVLDGLRDSQRTVYHAFYLLDAEAFEDQIWTKNKIQWYTELPSDRQYRIFGAIDPSLKTKEVKDGCDTAIAIIAKDNLNELWVLDYRLGKGVDVIYDWFFELYETWKILYAAIKSPNDGSIVTKKQVGTFRFFTLETTLFQELIAKELRKRMSEKNQWIPLRESRPVKEKTERILGAIDPLITNGKFHAKVGMGELETQIIRFGRPGQKVDLLDSIAQGELESNVVWKADKKKKIDAEYDEMYANASII